MSCRQPGVELPAWLRFWPLALTVAQLHTRHYHFNIWTRTPPWCDRKRLAQFYRDCPAGCHVDHIVPLNGRSLGGCEVSGLNIPENLQYLRAGQNMRKGNRTWPGMPDEPLALPLDHAPHQCRLI